MEQGSNAAALEPAIADIGEDGKRPFERVVSTRTSEEKWTLMLIDDDRGWVVFNGKPAFSCHFSPAAGYAGDEASQELAFHDAANERMFFDFRWQRMEQPYGDRLQDLLTRLSRIVQGELRRKK